MTTQSHHPPEPKRGITYVRVSDEGQVEGTSLDDQERQCAALFQNQGVEFVRSFRDEGLSAKTADRRALMEAVDFACDRRNRIGMFLVWKVDRFARNTEDHFAIRRMLNSAGVELRSATEPIGDEPNSKLFETIVAGFAEFDNSIRRIRCVNGMRARLRSGIWPFKPPVGYVSRSLARKGLKKTDPDPIDPVVFPIVQRILKGYARGIYTQAAMVEELKSTQFQTLTGIRPTLQLAERMLTSYLRFYAGQLRDAFGPEVEYHRGLHEPMITLDEMRAIECIRAGGARINVQRQRTTSEFPLKGLVRCSHCEKPFTAGWSRGRSRRYPYYHCYNADCPHRGRSVPKAKIEQEFSELLRRLAPSDQVFAALTESIALYWESRRGALESAATAHALTLKELGVRRDRIFELAEAGAYPPNVARERITAIDYEIAVARLNAPNGDAGLTTPVSLVDEAAYVIRIATAEWDTLDDGIRQRFKRLAFPEGILCSRADGFLNPKPSPIFRLNDEFGRPDFMEVDLCGLGSNQIIGELQKFAELKELLEGIQ